MIYDSWKAICSRWFPEAEQQETIHFDNSFYNLKRGKRKLFLGGEYLYNGFDVGDHSSIGFVGDKCNLKNCQLTLLVADNCDRQKTLF